MRFFRLLLPVIALLCLISWFWLRQPYSPSQDIPPVSFSAFQVNAVSTAAGDALAVAVREWPGITAAAYNTNSGLLAVGHTENITESDILQRIEVLTSQQVHKAVFPEPAGPQCPVPHALLTQIPGFLLLVGLSCSFLWLVLWLYANPARRFYASARS